MNIILEAKLAQSPLLDKDKYEIRQIFALVNDEKKQNILKNFDKMVGKILLYRQKLKQEQEILLGRALSNMEKAIKNARSAGLKKASKESILKLKNTL